MPDDRNLHPAPHEADRLIDRALASYTEVDLDPSLRARITARIGEARPRPIRLWSFAAVAACAAMLCLLIYLAPMHPPSGAAIATLPSSDRAPKRASHADAVPSRVPHPNGVRVRALAPSAVPRQHTSAIHNEGLRPARPSTSDSVPPTAEERALMQLAAERPGEAQRLLAVREEDREPLPATPLTFAPVHIAELSSPELPSPELPSPEPLHAD